VELALLQKAVAGLGRSRLIVIGHACCRMATLTVPMFSARPRECQDVILLTIAPEASADRISPVNPTWKQSAQTGKLCFYCGSGCFPALLYFVCQCSNPIGAGIDQADHFSSVLRRGFAAGEFSEQHEDILVRPIAPAPLNVGEVA
jgi:hypothetical protein